MGRLRYRDKEIVFEESEYPRIAIDGEPTQVSWDPDAGEFNAGELPYRSYESIEEMGKAIVDQRLSRLEERVRK